MTAAPTVPLAVPDLVTAVYLVPVPDGTELPDRLEPLALELLGSGRPTAAAAAAPGLVESGLLHVTLHDGEDHPWAAARSQGPAHAGEATAAPSVGDAPAPSTGAGLLPAGRVAAVQARGRPGLPAVHEWVARGCAAALAREWDSPVLDVAAGRLLTAPRALAGLPAPDGKVRLADWVVVPHEAGRRGYTITTVGLVRFGLPELLTADVPPQLVRAWGGALTGIAHRLLRAWAQAVRPGPDGATPAFVELPALLSVAADDVAAAYATVAGTPGTTRIALRYDQVSPAEPGHLRVVPPEDYPASAGEFLASVCADLFGATPSTVVYAKGSSGMAKAMHRARRQLPGVRERFLEGRLPTAAHLMVKYPLERGAEREYVWAYVTSWEAPEQVRGAAAVDAALDPRERVGRPVSVAAEAIVDWAVWVDGQGIVEGGATNEVLEGPSAVSAAQGLRGGPAHVAGAAAATIATSLRSLGAGLGRVGRRLASRGSVTEES
ncbi:MAG: hypothetical protein U0Q15_11840 [Kineosporiaceae bacterium]